MTDVGSQAPVHILFVIDQLCEAGGAERMLLETIRLLPKDRFRCSLITFKLDETLELFKELPCPHVVFPLRNTVNWDAFRSAREIRQFIQDEKVRIVHTVHETSDLWAGFITRMKGGPALVSSRRDMGILRSLKHNFGYRLMNSRFDLVLTVSDEVRRFCIQRDGLSPDKVLTLYNGLDLEKVTHSMSCELVGLNDQNAVIATVGNIRRVKGIDVLVETAAKVVRQFPEALFLVAGKNADPGHFQKIEARIAELSLEANVRFLGNTENIFSLLKMASVFFLPSRSEGFSNALIEAMACGLPCVATRVGGNAEAVVEGHSGYLVESEDDNSAAERILILLRNPVAAKKMGEAGRKSVEERFTSELMIKQLVKQYDRLLALRRN